MGRNWQATGNQDVLYTAINMNLSVHEIWSELRSYTGPITGVEGCASLFLVCCSCCLLEPDGTVWMSILVLTLLT